jgi:hypothetical protein
MWAGGSGGIRHALARQKAAERRRAKQARPALSEWSGVKTARALDGVWLPRQNVLLRGWSQ